VIEQLREDNLDLGQADGHVFISGETGTGKNLVAQALHAVGARAGRPFVTVACAAYGDAELFELLWPSDDAEGQGLFEQAKGGSLVLDGIENLPDTVQAKLLEYMDHGASSPLTGPRVIAICNAPDVESCESALRADLFFRLSALRIDLIPLRYRNEDVLPLFTHFIEQWAEEYGCDPLQLDAKEAAQLMQAPWPGNVRQLMNVAERAILQTRRGEGSVMSALNAGLNTAGAADMMPAPVVTGKPLREYIEAFECMLIDNTMRRHRGSVVSVMEELCLPRRTLNEKMAKYGLSRSDYL
jgi:DNA-binding NtrC family response regulator